MANLEGALVLASTSPQRRAILEQLRIPFTAVAPAYVEHDPPDADPVTLVRDHAEGKARSVHAAGAVTLGVDTTVHLDGRVYAKPVDQDDARTMLAELAGRTHLVISGLCLLGDRFTVVDHEVTAVRFREVTAAERELYLDAGEWGGGPVGMRSRASEPGSWRAWTATTSTSSVSPRPCCSTRSPTHAPNLLQSGR